MKILCIGNSFSEDATRYMHQIARADGYKMKVVNLYIGGCSFSEHFKNIMADKPLYDFQINGYSTTIYTTIKEALLSDVWDYVSLQQVSRQSIDFGTFEPFMSILSEYVKKYAPTAKQIIHQTWAYRPDSATMANLGYSCHEDMFKDIERSYVQAAKVIDTDIIIPSGAVMNRLVKNGLKNTHRDDIHASYGIGRYSLGLTWYKKLTGNSIDNNSFCDFDEEITPEEIEIIKKSVNEIV